MHVYRVGNMTCGHCVSTIEKAIRAVDAAATVDVDLAAGEVRVEDSHVGAARLAAAIGDAGYPTALLRADAGPALVTVSASRACCCG